jgi:AcrR family transcriptional regulator
MLNNADRPRKIPRQARSHATVQVILDATALLLVDEGYEQATTNRIAERAGVSIGSLYQYFPNRESVVAAVAHRLKAGISGPLWLTLSEERERDLRSDINLGLRTAIGCHFKTLPLSRILLEVTSSPAAVQWPAEAFRERQAVLRNFFKAHAGELRADFDIEAGSFFIPRMVGSAINAAILLRPGAFANGELERELTTMLTSYLSGAR